MADYKSYLAASILTEDKVVTYRLLSRALKVHVNAAKEMLYDFHSQQNAKRPEAVHATYLVSGTKRKETPVETNGGAKTDGEDDYMQSSPFMSSSMPQPEEDTGETSVLSISLVREEELDDLRSQYEKISAIHIYSLEPHPLKNLQVLSDVTRELQELCATEDPLESASKYGSIISKNVKRRAARRPPPAAAPVAAVKPKPSETKEPPKSSKPAKEEPKSQPSNANDFFGKGKVKAKPAATSKPSSKESTPNPPTLKRESSSIFKSFAKAKPKPKPEEEVVDEPMKDVSDDEEETYVPPPPSKEIEDSDRKSRKEREAVLKKMMEEDDDDEEPALATPEVVEEEEPVEEPKPKAESEEKEEPPVVSDGRRRGRRRVMKKKTVKDDEGYLVTKEEMAWESFSEDEPVAPKPKMQSSSTTTKTKKPAAKTGQGSIMSFFGKK
ncbi:DNA polymerase delta subunit [Lachnellula occidentalis]|uniref:DNA polymerase delta subunit 3 n=1 Tax=Lachnellula occidentalis TaxID=215460 RepID=A0A8H8RZT1_9HELO|nr:DNA polymerase delta subunit [Lachnellula occidentalis]